MKKKLGFSLIEVIIAVAIVTILSSIGIISNVKRNEKNALIEVEKKIPIFFETVCQRSFESGEKYKIHCELSEGKVELKRLETEEVIEKLNLPDTLNYVFFNSKNELISEVDRNTTTTGNISKGFSIYVFNNEGLATNKFSFSNTAEYKKYVTISEKKPNKEMYLENFTYGRELTEEEENLKNYNNWE